MKSSLVVILSSVLLLGGCLPPPQHHTYRPAPPAPCGPTVAPISYNSLIVQITINGTYTMKDLPSAQQNIPLVIVSELNALGRANGNTFALQNGQNMNFWYHYTINNNNGQFTGSLEFGGWGQGFIHTFTTQYPYVDGVKMMTDLADQSYAFISGGWHDTRPACAGR